MTAIWSRAGFQVQWSALGRDDFDSARILGKLPELSDGSSGYRLVSRACILQDDLDHHQGAGSSMWACASMRLNSHFAECQSDGVDALQPRIGS